MISKDMKTVMLDCRDQKQQHRGIASIGLGRKPWREKNILNGRGKDNGSITGQENACPPNVGVQCLGREAASALVYGVASM